MLRCEACARKGVDRETIGGGGERGWVEERRNVVEKGGEG